jgi:ribosomal protein S12 methylthiotransferase
MKNGLAHLIAELEGIEGLAWIRLMYMYPSGIDDKLIETIAASRRVVHYIDIPVQHANNAILRAMRRSDTKERNMALIEKLRRAMPDVSLRTTVMVGFPGENDVQFEELLEFVRWAQFDHLGCFPFYAEPGTPAAEFPGQVPDEVKKQRVDILMKVQQEVVFRKLRQSLGRRIWCLVDSRREDGLAECRYYGQAPYIDTVCFMEECPVGPGEFIEGTIVDIRDYDLVVEPV